MEQTDKYKLLNSAPSISLLVQTHHYLPTTTHTPTHTAREPNSLDLLGGLWLMWHIPSPCSDAERWGTMVGVTQTHTYTHFTLTLNMDLVTYAWQTSATLASPWMMSGWVFLRCLSLPPLPLSSSCNSLKSLPGGPAEQVEEFPPGVLRQTLQRNKEHCFSEDLMSVKDIL